jgi:cobalt-precorrin-6B (C15)-methyltransferase
MKWIYRTPGIPDRLFEQSPGIYLSKREVRLMLISALQMKANSVLWDLGAGTGTIPIEIGLLCPEATIIAVERDEDVVALIERNCSCFGVTNVEIVTGSAPECLQGLRLPPDRVCVEGGRNIKAILKEAWQYLPQEGRIVATASNLESLYQISESLSELQARNVEVVQAAVNRLETRGRHQTLAAVDPIFILSGEKLED